MDQLIDQLTELRDAVDQAPVAPHSSMAALQTRVDRMHRHRLTKRIAGAGLVAVAGAIAGAIAVVAWPRTGAHVAVRAGAGAGAGAGALPVAKADGLPLIGRGETQPMFLDDGTPVWEVRYSNGSVMVLGAAIPLADPTFPVSGLKVLTFWAKAERQFHGSAVFDDHGRVIGFSAPFVGGNPAHPTEASDMAAYDIKVSGDSVIVGAAHPGAIRHFDAHATVGGSGGYEMNQIDSFDKQPPGYALRTLADAATRPPGTMSPVDAVIIVDRGGPPRLCSLGHRLDHFPFPACPMSSPVPEGLAAHGDPAYVTALGGGPLFVRVRGGQFYDVVLSGAGQGGYRFDGTEPAALP